MLRIIFGVREPEKRPLDCEGNIPYVCSILLNPLGDLHRVIYPW